VNTPSPVSVLFGAILELQTQLRRFPEESEAYAIAEKAIDLALSPRRRRSSGHPGFFRFDAWRDARRSLRRSRARRHALRQRLENAAHIGGKTAGHPGWWDRATPEAMYAARELELRIRRGIARRHPLGVAVLDALLMGEPEQDTAGRLGVSRSAVSRLRAHIRKIAGALTGPGVA
jgi:hypothetical protein